MVRAISAESIYRYILLKILLDHILYRRAHFVLDARSASRAVLAIKVRFSTFATANIFEMYYCTFENKSNKKNTFENNSLTMLHCSEIEIVNISRLTSVSLSY